MTKFDDFTANEQIKAEYKKIFLLNLFQKLCVRMSKNPDIKKRIQNLYRQSYNKTETTGLVVKREFDYDMTVDEADLFYTWIMAHFKKSNTRKTLPLELKKALYEKQHGVCVACGEELGSEWKKIHIDHIIPFKLVGDELNDNYQVLCDVCNECKSARIDYIFKSMLKLN